MTHVLSPRGPHRSTVPRSERHRQVVALVAEGLNQAEIARRLGIGSSYVSGLLLDPDGTKDRERKARNGSICVDCGERTSGGDGPRERCLPCMLIHRKTLKVWTREAVLDAIQRFAAEHGRPPTATEWTRADPDHDYPGRTSVYRSQRRSTSPFATWSDAIAAAGFPRPMMGAYERTPETLAKLSEALRGPRPHTRRFSYEEAQRLRDRGVPPRELAVRFGVSYSTIVKKTRKVAA